MGIPDPDIEGTTTEVPWEPRAAESSRAYLAFASYRDLGPMRSLRKAAAAFYEGSASLVASEAQLRQFGTWSSHHEWVKRAEAWDLHLDQISRIEAEEAAKEMRRQWGRLAAAMRGPIGETLQAMGEARTLLTPGQLTDWLRTGKDVEAWAREVPAEVLDHAIEAADAGRADILGELFDEVEAMRARRAQR